MSAISFDDQEDPKKEIEFNAIDKILKGAITSLLPSDTSTFRVLRIGGISSKNYSSRRLEELVVEFEFIMESKCDTTKCDNSHDSSGRLIENTKKSLDLAVSSGELATSLMLNSRETSLMVFDNIEVKSFTVNHIATKINAEKEDENTSASTKMLTPLLILYLIYALIM